VSDKGGIWREMTSKSPHFRPHPIQASKFPNWSVSGSLSFYLPTSELYLSDEGEIVSIPFALH